MYAISRTIQNPSFNTPYDVTTRIKSLICKNRFKATKEFMEFFKEEHKDEPIYCLPQSEAFVQSRLANQSVVAYNPRLPAALATSVLTHGVWKILKLKF